MGVILTTYKSWDDPPSNPQLGDLLTSPWLLTTYPSVHGMDPSNVIEVSRPAIIPWWMIQPLPHPRRRWHLGYMGWRLEWQKPGYFSWTMGMKFPTQWKKGPFHKPCLQDPYEPISITNQFLMTWEKRAPGYLGFVQGGPLPVVNGIKWGYNPYYK